MTGHVTVPTRLVARWNIRTTLPWSILGKSNSVTLAKTCLSLVLLLRWGTIPNVGSRWTILSPGHYRSFRLRSTCLISPLMALGCSIYRIVVLLS
jgi:hypothetical protein